jgi:hypothetical protein
VQGRERHQSVAAPAPPNDSKVPALSLLRQQSAGAASKGGRPPPAGARFALVYRVSGQGFGFWVAVLGLGARL